MGSAVAQLCQMAAARHASSEWDSFFGRPGQWTADARCSQISGQPHRPASGTRPGGGPCGCRLRRSLFVNITKSRSARSDAER
jgi:hypothetical protein